MLTTFPYCNFSVGFPQLFIENLIIFGGVQYAWQFRNKAFPGCVVLQSLSCLFVTTPWPLTFIIIGRWRNISAGKSNSMTSTKKSQADIINWGSDDIKDLKYLERIYCDCSQLSKTQGSMTYVNDPSGAQSKPSTFPQNSGKYKTKVENETYTFQCSIQQLALFQRM